MDGTAPPADLLAVDARLGDRFGQKIPVLARLQAPLEHLAFLHQEPPALVLAAVVSACSAQHRRLTSC